MCEILDLVVLLVYTECLSLIKSMFGKLVDLSQNELLMEEANRTTSVWQITSDTLILLKRT